MKLVCDMWLGGNWEQSLAETSLNQIVVLNAHNWLPLVNLCLL